jgi:hypothetical protein
MALPLLGVFYSGYEFISGSWEYLKAIGEVRSFLTLDSTRRVGLDEAIANYSAYIPLLPVTLGYVLYSAWHRPALDRLFLALFFLMTSFLLLQQMRFHYFGSFMLFVSAAMIFQRPVFPAIPGNARLLGFIALSLLAPWMPAGNLFKKQPPSPVFEAVYWASKNLQEQCETDPGIILAPPEVGHYLTYFTKCSVVANSFVMAPQDFEFLNRTERYLNMSARELSADAGEIKYVFLMRRDNIFRNLGREKVVALNPRLSLDLLFADSLPEGYRPVYEVKFRLSGKDSVFARAVRVMR